MNPRRIHQCKILLLVAFGLLLLALLGLVVWQQRREILADRAQKAGSALLDFAEERAQLSQRQTNESFEEYEQRISAESAETQSLYTKRYLPEVTQLRKEFARRGVKREVVDEFYQSPGSVIAIREIGNTLFDMGVDLRAQRLSVKIKQWIRHPFLFSTWPAQFHCDAHPQVLRGFPVGFRPRVLTSQ